MAYSWWQLGQYDCCWRFQLEPEQRSFDFEPECRFPFRFRLILLDVINLVVAERNRANAMHLIFAMQNNEVCFQCVRIKGSASLLLAENILYVDTVTSLWESIYSK